MSETPDLIAWLRTQRKHAQSVNWTPLHAICLEAAAEIERLTTALATAGADAKKWRGEWDALDHRLEVEKTDHEFTKAALATAERELDALKALADVPEGEERSLVSFASICDSIDSKSIEDRVYGLVMYHIRRADRAERERDEALERHRVACENADVHIAMALKRAKTTEARIWREAAEIAHQRDDGSSDGHSITAAALRETFTQRATQAETP